MMILGLIPLALVAYGIAKGAKWALWVGGLWLAANVIYWLRSSPTAATLLPLKQPPPPPTSDFGGTGPAGYHCGSCK